MGWEEGGDSLWGVLSSGSSSWECSGMVCCTLLIEERLRARFMKREVPSTPDA